jgi:hypothetical protein
VNLISRKKLIFVFSFLEKKNLCKRVSTIKMATWATISGAVVNNESKGDNLKRQIVPLKTYSYFDEWEKENHEDLFSLYSVYRYHLDSNNLPTISFPTFSKLAFRGTRHHFVGGKFVKNRNTRERFDIYSAVKAELRGDADDEDNEELACETEYISGLFIDLVMNPVLEVVAINNSRVKFFDREDVTDIMAYHFRDVIRAIIQETLVCSGRDSVSEQLEELGII